jgi:hypothetical protein
MEKKRIIKSIDHVDKEVIDAIRLKYPDGWANHVMRVSKGNGEFFHAITVDTADASYMIKVNVKIDSLEELEKFANRDDTSGGKDEDDDAFADDDSIADDDSDD